MWKNHPYLLRGSVLKIYWFIWTSHREREQQRDFSFMGWLLRCSQKAGQRISLWLAVYHTDPPNIWGCVSLQLRARKLSGYSTQAIGTQRLKSCSPSCTSVVGSWNLELSLKHRHSEWDILCPWKNFWKNLQKRAWQYSLAALS